MDKRYETSKQYEEKILGVLRQRGEIGVLRPYKDLFAALNRMEGEGIVTSKEKEGPHGPERVYRIAMKYPKPILALASDGCSGRFQGLRRPLGS